MVIVPGGDFKQFVDGVEIQFYQDASPWTFSPKVDIEYEGETYRVEFERWTSHGSRLDDKPAGPYVLLEGVGEPPEFVVNQPTTEFDIQVKGVDADLVYTFFGGDSSCYFAPDEEVT